MLYQLLGSSFSVVSPFKINFSGKQFFASSSCDGTLKVWDSKSKECLKTFDIYPKSNDVDLSKVRGAIQFDSYENLIVAKENEVILNKIINMSRVYLLLNLLILNKV